MTSISPAWILIGGAVLLAVTRGSLRRTLSLVVPLAALAAVWSAESLFRLGFVDHLLAFFPAEPAAPGASPFDEAARMKLSRLFGTVFTLMAFTGAWFAWSMRRPVELPSAFLYAGSALGVVFASDWLTLFIYWELMAVGSTVVVWSGGQEHSASAAMRYAVVHLLGGVLLMIGLVIHLSGGGSPDVAPLALEVAGEWSPAAIFVLLGMLVNAGAPPFSSWLPDAYPEASESGMVFLSAFTTKTAVFTLMLTFPGEELLLAVGATMALYGIVYAILENDMRRILAYSIINQVGFMVCGIGLGTNLALNGAAAHAFAHIIYKALLLMSAGSVLLQTGKRRCTDLGGLYRTMPITLWCGTIGALAISAFPLTSGFVTKSMISSAAHYEHETLVWFLLTAASAGVFLHAGIKFPWFVFFQKDSGLRPPDPPKSMRGSMLFFAFLCVALGVAYPPLYAILPFGEGDHIPYHPFTFAHVLQQLQLLLFSGLAFFLMLPLLKRTVTITLDFDWSYRRLGPVLWNGLAVPIGRAAVSIKNSVYGLVRHWLGADLHVPGVGGYLLERWPVGRAVVLVTLVLLVYMGLNLGWEFLERTILENPGGSSPPTPR